MAILLNVYGTPQRHKGVILTDKAGVRVARVIDNRFGRAVLEGKVEDYLQYLSSSQERPLQRPRVPPPVEVSDVNHSADSVGNYHGGVRLGITRW